MLRETCLSTLQTKHLSVAYRGEVDGRIVQRTRVTLQHRRHCTKVRQKSCILNIGVLRHGTWRANKLKVSE